MALDQIAGCLNIEACAPLRNNYLEWINAAIAKSPKHAVYYYIKGKAQRANGDILGAINTLQQAHDISPHFLHPLFEMAAIFIQLNELKHAEQIIGQIETANEKTTFRRDRDLKQIKHILENRQSLRTKQ